ncbi:MAG: hypothetical protein CMM93_01595 [Rickettsiales bacterium]|nr:hypothetical protein [Rickettsiales bacterium]|tara:strand:- start:378 stop:869 length:492 start_codon:yes stop_codon:yes gene_type:complete
MSRARGLQNVNKLRRKLRRMEKHIASEIPNAIEDTLKAVVADAIQNAPEDTGDMAAEIEYKMRPDGLAGAAGPGAASSVVRGKTKGNAFASKAGRMSRVSAHRLLQFFKGYWTEFGTKGNPAKNIPPQPARPFMQPAWDANRAWAIARVRRAVNEQLKRVQNL